MAIGRRWGLGQDRFAASVSEFSIDGFTISVAAADVSRLRLGRRWSLRHQGQTTPVLARWFYQGAEGPVQIGLQRLDVETPPKLDCFASQIRPDGRLGFLTRRPTAKLVLVAGVLATGVLISTLPGTGDRLGAAQPVRQVVHSLIQFFPKSTVRSGVRQ